MRKVRIAAFCGLIVLLVPSTASATEVRPPQPYPGGAGGCVVADPSGAGTCVTPALAWLFDQVRYRFGTLEAICWDAHAWNPRSDHPRGRACDFTIGELGEFPGPELVAEGWRLARWLRRHAHALRVHYVIWQGKIWSWEHDDKGWRPYDGAGGIYDPKDASGGHYDHVHVSTVDKPPAQVFESAKP